nr:uncharacterized protein LOC104112999 [Nicotiana tomentosiformis]
MAEECRLTIVGKFLRTRPQIEKIRSKFAEKISTKGNVKIGVYDYRTVFLDFTNEDDFKSVWFKRSIEIEGQIMSLEKWTPDFKPDVDSPIVPVWVLLPELSFHCHTWHYVKQIAGPIGTPLSMDIATDYRTRPNIAKVRVEVDLTKPKLNSIWVGSEDEQSPLNGFTQNLEYENVPKYCRHCKLLGHSILQCRKIEKNSEGDEKDKGKNIVEEQGSKESLEEGRRGKQLGKSEEEKKSQQNEKTKNKEGERGQIKEKSNV